MKIRITQKRQADFQSALQVYRDGHTNLVDAARMASRVYRTNYKITREEREARRNQLIDAFMQYAHKEGVM